MTEMKMTANFLVNLEDFDKLEIQSRSAIQAARVYLATFLTTGKLEIQLCMEEGDDPFLRAIRVLVTRECGKVETVYLKFSFLYGIEVDEEAMAEAYQNDMAIGKC